MKFLAASTVIGLIVTATVSFTAGIIAFTPTETYSDSHAVTITEAYQKGLDEGKALGHTRSIMKETQWCNLDNGDWFILPDKVGLFMKVSNADGNYTMADLDTGELTLIQYGAKVYHVAKDTNLLWSK